MASISGSLDRLKASEEEIVRFLVSANLNALSTKATEMQVISLRVKRSFDSLDPNVPRPRKIRYLLIQAYEQLKAHPRLLERWLKMLCSHGVPSDMLRKAKDVGTTDVGSSEGDKCSQNVARFSEEHVSALSNLLSSCSGKWQNICLSLNLPRDVKKNLEARLHMYDNILCLNEVLHEWIVGHHKHAKAPTLENLKKALESEMVGFGKIASKINKDTLSKHGICFTLPVQKDDSLCNTAPSSKKARLDMIDIVSQPLGIEVAEGKSTLLEVGVDCVNAISYQWVKDGSPLEDDSEHYFGSKQSILCITASLATEGTYTCEVRSTSSAGSDQLLAIMLFWQLFFHMTRKFW